MNSSLPCLVIGFLIGLVPAFVLLFRNSKSGGVLDVLRERLASRDARIMELEKEGITASERLLALQGALGTESVARSAAESRSSRIPGLEQQVEELRREKSQLQAERERLQTALDKDQESAQEKIRLLTDAKDALGAQFKVLADEILQAKVTQFSEQNKAIAERNETSLGNLLDPLRTQLGDFRKKIEDVYIEEGKDRVELKKQVEMLADLNRTISEEARNLTTALKGSNKTQGNYGELVLERVLESSGLRKGEEYHVQVSHSREDGSRVQPDVIIHLPEGRRLVVDSKISLDAYQIGVTAEDAGARETAIKAHIASVQNHIKGLSVKNYQQLYGIQSLDFVIMFIPLEPAFMMAVAHEKDLFMDAWSRNVLLVSPSTLLFVVRTVAHLWRQEAQTRNAQEIAERGAELYDKLAGFVKDFEGLGGRLKQAQEEYDDARGKLSTGRGNVIRQAEILKELGVKPTKSLPAKLVEQAREELPRLGPQEGG